MVMNGVLLYQIWCIFVIIFYLDVGKMILIEKLFLLGGVIWVVGQVCVCGECCCVWFDWMKIEQECGILVFLFVMMFECKGIVYNLFDILGYEDFFEDMYCMLIVVDVVVMVIDVVKGIEIQICKLFEVC